MDWIKRGCYNLGGGPLKGWGKPGVKIKGRENGGLTRGRWAWGFWVQGFSENFWFWTLDFRRNWVPRKFGLTERKKGTFKTYWDLIWGPHTGNFLGILGPGFWVGTPRRLWGWAFPRGETKIFWVLIFTPQFYLGVLNHRAPIKEGARKILRGENFLSEKFLGPPGESVGGGPGKKKPFLTRVCPPKTTGGDI